MTSWWRQFRARFARKPPVITTVIDGQEHTVTEWARKQAAINLKLNPRLKAEIERMVGADEARRRYPEAYL